MTTDSQINANQAVLESVAALEPRRTLYGDVWHILRRRKLAMISAAVLSLYVLTALLAFAGLFDKRIDIPIGDSNAAPALHDAAGHLTPALFFGTDFLGRSVLWRFLYGARVALTVAVLASIITEVIGVVLGLIAGYFGGWIDNLIIWLFSTVNSVPYILLLMAFAFVLRNQEIKPFALIGIQKSFPLSGIPTIILALGLTSWVGICRLIRGEVLRLRDRDYVAAARAVGVGTPRLLRKHILPNVFHLIIIDFSLGLGAFVQAEVILSFLGLGVTDQPSWGRMIDDAKLELLKGVWWQLAAATIAIFVFSLAVNIFGDALRDALDPRVRE
jgi:ABC-type dipeptide/oligopeptide/nickel transport system permease subunit